MASTSQSTNTGGASKEWKYPSFRLAEVNGGFVHPSDDPERMWEWIFDPNLKGTYFTDRIDSIGCESKIGPDEMKKAEKTFRDSFYEAVLKIISDFPCDVSPRETYIWIFTRMEAAETIRVQQRRATEVAKPSHNWPDYPGEILFSIGHWIEGSRLRAIHHAWSFAQRDWAHLDVAPDYLKDSSCYCPSEDSLQKMQDIVLPKWLSAVRTWYPSSRCFWPPHPIGERTGTLDLVTPNSG